MTLREIYSAKNEQKFGFFAEKTPVISFEIFPPKNDIDGEKLEKLIAHLAMLKKYNPAFISLTYGAGGTNQDFSLGIIKRVQRELNLTVMPHFTCVGASRESVRNYLNEIQSLGLKNILALRGDIPEGVVQTNFDFKYANELVEFIKSHTQLSIGVAGYPEGHIDCTDLFVDLDNLKRKVDAGADAIYTQMFFDNDKFFGFVQLARDAGIDVPIIPGILPIMNFGQFERMLSMAKVSVPKPLMERLERFKDNPEDSKKIGVEFASYQCQQLIDAEVAGLHFYTLNTSISVSPILDNLGLECKVQSAKGKM
jgi:methylenetetrahydrofolate reductase (NADPH)